jgi:hypothetical protein
VVVVVLTDDDEVFIFSLFRLFLIMCLERFLCLPAYPATKVIVGEVCLTVGDDEVLKIDEKCIEK